jgi:amidase
MWAAFFEHYDVLLAPVALTVAFPHDHKEPLIYRRLVVNGKKRSYLDNLAWTTMAIVSGLPATVAPVGLSESGLPVGVQIIGARLSHAKSAATWLSAVTLARKTLRVSRAAGRLDFRYLQLIGEN